MLESIQRRPATPASRRQAQHRRDIDATIATLAPRARIDELEHEVGHLHDLLDRSELRIAATELALVADQHRDRAA